MIWDYEQSGHSEHTDLDPRAAGSQPRAMRPRRSRWASFLRFIGGLTLFAAIAAGLYFGYTTGWIAAQLRPSSVIVRGAELSQATDVLAELELTADTALPRYWWQCWRYKSGANRWLAGVTMVPSLGRSAVIEARERRPLAAVHCGALRGWLCDDGLVVPALATDTAERFSRIAALPPLLLPAGYLEADASQRQIVAQPLGQSEEVLAVLAACALDLPGQVREVLLAEDGAARLRCRDGFEVRLGGMDNLALKLAALPKALRLCEGSREKLLYLDASDSGIFYQKWKEAPVVDALSTDQT